MEELHQKYGLELDASWVRENCEGAAQAAEIILEKVLSANLGDATSRGCLPRGLENLHKRSLPGPLTLQIVRSCDVSRPLCKRKDPTEILAGDENEGDGAVGGMNLRQTGTQRRALRLLLSDGHQCADAFEETFIPSLTSLCEGQKLVLKNIPVRRGMLLLCPGNTVVLGGNAPLDCEDALPRSNVLPENEVVVAPESRQEDNVVVVEKSPQRPQPHEDVPQLVSLMDVARASPGSTHSVKCAAFELETFKVGGDPAAFHVSLIVIDSGDSEGISVTLSQNFCRKLFGISARGYSMLKEVARKAKARNDLTDEEKKASKRRYHAKKKQIEIAMGGLGGIMTMNKTASGVVEVLSAI